MHTKFTDSHKLAQSFILIRAVICCFIIVFPLSGNAQNISRDEVIHVTVMPRLARSFSLDIGYTQRGQLTHRAASLPANGFKLGLGYHHFLDPHGIERFRLIANTYLAGDSVGLGLTMSYAVRGYSQNFAYGGGGIRLMFRHLWIGEHSGVEVGAGLELPTLGSLFWDQPYLFADMTSVLMLTYSSVSANGIGGNIAIFGGVELSFDWASVANSPKGNLIWE